MKFRVGRRAEKSSTSDPNVWETLAKKDAMWAACTCGKRHVTWQPDEFIASGEREVSWASDVAEESLNHTLEGSLAVDFGCGPGRLIGALKARFRLVVGIDTSETMLRLARDAYPETDVSFSESTRTLSEDSVDLVYSTFVLQHLTQDQLDQSLREFARIVRPEGMVIFQYPARPHWTLLGAAFILLPVALINAIERHIVRYPGIMPISWMAPERLIRRSATCGLVILEHRIGPKYSPNWKDVWYFAQKDGARKAAITGPVK